MKKLFILLLIVLVACSAQEPIAEPIDDKPEPQPPSQPQTDIGEVPKDEIIVEAKPALPKETPKTKEPPQDHQVTIARYKFFPKLLEINQGDTVIWKNLGNTPHEVRSLKFYSNPLQKNNEFSYTFTQKGNNTINSARYPATQMKVVVK